MKKHIQNERGAVFLVSVALIAVIASAISSVSLVALVRTDHFQAQFQHDAIQEELLLRSESKRTQMSIEFDKIRPLPDRTVEILSDDFRRTVYQINNSKQLTTIDNFMGWATAEALVVNSLISARRGSRFGSNNSQSDKFYYKRESPIKRYSEKLLRNESLAQYQYFTQYESSENADGGTAAAAVKFWAQDELYGPVHSNSDICLLDDSWPVFHEMVTTSGRFKVVDLNGNFVGYASEIAPMGEIFLGGWEENVPEIVFLPTADDIKNNGIHPFPDDIDIAYVKLSGGGYVSKVANIVLVEVREFDVYSWYPSTAAQVLEKINANDNWFEDSDNIWTNQVAIYDTLWSEGPSGSLSDISVWVECELWIEGQVSGKTTFGCADTIYITKDITYAGTTPGQAPDDENAPNLSDYFGLVSEEKILIKYKHRDPFNNNQIQSPNCDNISLYGAFAAIGEGDIQQHGSMACHYDGIFSYEYQHPHGSTPSFIAPSPYNGQETTYNYIDLHKFIYPANLFVPTEIFGFVLHGAAAPMGYACCGFPIEDIHQGHPDPNGYVASYPNAGFNYTFPHGTDYPWYNPVWPESSLEIVFERGDIRMFGAIAQRRRGFVHRSGNDEYNHPQGNQNPSPWEIDQYHYDGNHSSVGYNKDYHFDQRLKYVQPPDYPEIYRGFGEYALTSFKENNWIFKIPPE